MVTRILKVYFFWNQWFNVFVVRCWLLHGANFYIGRRCCGQMIREKKERAAATESARRKAVRAIDQAICVVGENIDVKSISLADYLRLLEFAKGRAPVRSKRLQVRWVEEW